VHLREAVAVLGGLDAPVAQGGANFSLGQKQLVRRGCALAAVVAGEGVDSGSTCGVLGGC